MPDNAYIRRSRKYLSQAAEELARKDLCQASEKGWGAASQVLKALASERGWRPKRHNNLYEAVRQLVAETNDEEFRVLFGMAGELHTNFYEDFLNDVDVSAHLRHVSRFVDKVEGLLAVK